MDKCIILDEEKRRVLTFFGPQKISKAKPRTLQRTIWKPPPSYSH